MSDKYTDRMKDYVDVAARIQEFTAKHPGGSLQPVKAVCGSLPNCDHLKCHYIHLVAA